MQEPSKASQSVNSDTAEETEVRLRDVINMIIGVCITLAPSFNGDSDYTHGAIRLRMVAACVCAVSLWIVAHQRDVRAEFLNTFLGLALVTAPLWRGGIDPYRVNMALAGAVVAAFSASCAIRILRERPAPQLTTQTDPGDFRISAN